VDGVKPWQKIVIPLLITVVIGGAYLLYVWKQRQNPGVIPQAETAQVVSADDLAVVRELPSAHFDDVQDLEGKRVWMRNGYTMPYFAYTAGRVDFTRQIGLVPAAQPMDVKKVIKAAVPAKVDDRIDHGSRQVLAVFEMPGKQGTFATPVGSIDGSEEQYYINLLFYFDDPHTIYSHWPKDVWAAVDAHQVKTGMSELQTRMSIGQKEHPDGQTEGDRTVTYDQDGKHWTVTYAKDRATSVQGG
jgi:hypothetical protein